MFSSSAAVLVCSISVFSIVMMVTTTISATNKFDTHFLDEVIGDGNNNRTTPATMSPMLSFRKSPGEDEKMKSVTRTKVNSLSKIFKKTVQRLRESTKRLDLVFLIDSSSSVGKANFMSEIKFVKKMLADFNVSYNYTRVAIVTFSSRGKIVSKKKF